MPAYLEQPAHPPRLVRQHGSDELAQAHAAVRRFHVHVVGSAEQGARAAFVGALIVMRTTSGAIDSAELKRYARHLNRVLVP